ncbi:sulfatase-like hydrolase/transferase [Halopiger goleimassiliensis]|uniref:sulfatase-like hydrolase/transferase n=1 Tax=Halopiger goleimassiliensis TaxID=1293048 RepID=UPI000677EAEC|nr:sulfatase-like hydrolase/transferase [Halopiger goleimassiliensis]
MATDRSPNVFLLSADSLNQQSFANAATEIASLVDGVEFTHAVATASDTNSAMPGLAAGVYSDTVPGWGLPSDNAPTTLAESLAAAGYDCGLWSDNYLFGEQYGYGSGFTGGNRGEASWKKQLAGAFRDGPLEPLLGAAEWAYFNVFSRIASTVTDDETFYKPAERLHDEALEWLDRSRDRSVCCWIHYMDTHHPYEPPREYLESVSLSRDWDRVELGRVTRQAVKANGRGYSSDDVGDVHAAYEACCRYLRDEVLEFVDDLVRREFYDPDRDVLVFTADHGECLRPDQYDMMGHVPPAFWENIVRVPLVIARPDWQRDVIDDQVSLVDLMPTVLEATGVDVPESTEGRACSRPNEMYRDRAFFVTQWGEEERGSMRTFRGVRNADGTKVFGGNLDGSDIEFACTFDDGDDEIIYRGSGIEQEAPDRQARDLATDLRQRRGPLVDDGTVPTRSSDDLESHLRDLGYIE